MSDTKVKLFSAAALLATAWMRSCGLAGKSIWVDEAITWHYADMSLSAMVREVAAFDAHPPLYYLLAWLGHRIWPAPVGLRLPSFLSGLALPVAVFALCRLAEDRRTARMAFALACLSSYLTSFCQEARNYCWTALIACLCPLLLLHLRRTGSSRAWVWWSVLCLACLYSYLYLAILLAVLALWWAWQVGIPKGRLAWAWAASVGAAGLLFLPWLPVVLNRASAGGAGSGWRPGFGPWDMVHLVNAFSLGPHQYLAESLPGWPVSGLILALPWAGLTLAGIWVSRERWLWASLLLGVPALVWILPVHLHVFDPKHLFFLLPFLLLCQAKAMLAIRSFSLRGICCGVWILINLSSYAWYQSDSYGKSGWDEATLLVSQKGRTEDLVVFDPFYVGYAFDFYVPRDCSIEARWGASEDPSVLLQEVERAARPWQRVWLLSSRGLVTTPSGELPDWLSKRRPLLEATVLSPAGSYEQLMVALFGPEGRP